MAICQAYSQPCFNQLALLRATPKGRTTIPNRSRYRFEETRQLRVLKLIAILLQHARLHSMTG